MGADLQVSSVRPSGYQLVDRDHHKLTYLHLPSGDILEEYTLPFPDRKQLSRNKQVLTYRNSNIDNIVQLKGWEETSLQEYCLKVPALRIFLSKIRYRLQDLNELNLNQAILLLRDSLIGFSNLFSFSPLLYRPTAKMICLDNQKVVRVWWNQDLTRQFPESHPQSLEDPECFLVQSVIDLVQSKCRQNPFPLIMSQNLKTLRGFDRTIKRLSAFLKSKEDWHPQISQILLSPSTDFTTPRREPNSVRRSEEFRKQNSGSIRLTESGVAMRQLFKDRVETDRQSLFRRSFK